MASCDLGVGGWGRSIRSLDLGIASLLLRCAIRAHNLSKGVAKAVHEGTELLNSGDEDPVANDCDPRV